MIVDPHTADGIKVARNSAPVRRPDDRDGDGPPVKVPIVEAIGIEPDRPAAFEGLEDLPRFVIDIPADAALLKTVIRQRLGALAR